MGYRQMRCEDVPLNSYDTLRQQKSVLCAFTVDVEDWYQSCIDFDAPITDLVKRNTHKILELLDEKRVRGTFFVQGMVAERFPDLVREIHAEGHEVQSHGYSHRPLTAMSESEFRTEMELARKTVEDACGRQVTAFRAPDFTISEDNLWMLKVLCEMGFQVDSSIFPCKTRRYGIARWRRTPHRVAFDSGSSILEVPVAVWSKCGWDIPMAGGGYFRLLPFTLIVRMFRHMLWEGTPIVVYCHPYEFSPGEVFIHGSKVPLQYKVHQNAGRRSIPGKLRALFGRFSFGSLDDLLKAWIQT